MSVRTFFGELLLFFGFIIVAVSGTCSLFVGLNKLSQPSDETPLQLILLIGGIPFVFGLILVLVGIWLRRRRPPELSD